MHTFENHRLGENNETISIDTIEEHRLATVMMAQQAQRNLAIVNRELDPMIYDTSEFIDVVRKMVLENRRSLIRILVFEPALIARRGHRLLEFASNLSSFFELRNAGTEHRDYNRAMFIADEIGYVQSLSAERYEGKLNFSDRSQSQLLLNEFQEMWDRSVPDPNLRRVML